MWFWKAFAWITLVWAGVARRGKGILIRKSSADSGPAGETEPLQQSGPTWRRVSSSKGYPGRRSSPGPETSGEATTSGASTDKTDESPR
ncbi:MAG: hypothetical protein AAF657_30930 [Acidobacteriota bacterium]